MSAVIDAFFVDTNLLPPQHVLRGLVDRMDEGMCIFRKDGGLVFANTAIYKALSLREVEQKQFSAHMDAFLPKEAIYSASKEGHWSGQVQIGKDRATACVYHHEEKGAEDYFLAIIYLKHQQCPLENQATLSVSDAQYPLRYGRLTGAEDKLLQAEKMASIGQLAAGVAHEINNPIGYVHSNLGTLQEYLRSLLSLIDAYERALVSDNCKKAETELHSMRTRVDFDFIKQDLPQLMSESREGIERVKRIVRDLKDFSYADRSECWKKVDLHAGLESTINIIWNELKYKVRLERNYAALPLIECLPFELNQVYMNLLLNAGQSIAEKGVITITSGREGSDSVWISVQDNGSGIPLEHQQRIFEPFFTTKPVGRGTGLGLAISYSIIDKHHGRIDVSSTPGRGSTFRIILPIHQPR